MQEERSDANGTPKRESSGPVTYGENEDSSRARGELRSRRRRDRSSSGNLDLRGFEDPNENFVQLVNSVMPSQSNVLVLNECREQLKADSSPFEFAMR